MKGKENSKVLARANGTSPKIDWKQSEGRAGEGLEGHPSWSCAPGTEEGMEPDDLLCSRNARSGTPLVGRAQWKINQPPSLEK